jgi:hypothetical protein
VLATSQAIVAAATQGSAAVRARVLRRAEADSGAVVVASGREVAAEVSVGEGPGAEVAPEQCSVIARNDVIRFADRLPSA